MTPSGIEPATFRLVAQCLNQLRHPYKQVMRHFFQGLMLLGRNDGLVFLCNAEVKNLWSCISIPHPFLECGVQINQDLSNR